MCLNSAAAGGFLLSLPSPRRRLHPPGGVAQWSGIS